MLVGAAGERLEGLAFLPDAHATAIHAFAGGLYNGGAGSALGSGGLFLAAHQGNGRIYVYDIGLQSGASPIFVNFYGPVVDGTATLRDLSGLDFHAPSAKLYALWDNPTDGQEQGRLAALDPAAAFAPVAIWRTAVDSIGEEGIALLDSGTANGLSRIAVAEDDPIGHGVRLFSAFPVIDAPTTTTLPADPCGDPTGDGRITATDALGVLRAAVGSDACQLCVCDVDSSGIISAVDALRTLSVSVGQISGLSCPLC
jgi:hypothetical protein